MTSANVCTPEKGSLRSIWVKICFLIRSISVYYGTYQIFNFDKRFATVSPILGMIQVGEIAANRSGINGYTSLHFDVFALYNLAQKYNIFFNHANLF